MLSLDVCVVDFQVHCPSTAIFRIEIDADRLVASPIDEPARLATFLEQEVAMTLPDIAHAIKSTPFVDTHEHLLEETTRLAGPGAHGLQPCDDAALLFYHYAADDLWSSGMTIDERTRFFSPDVDPADKWSIVEPYWRRSRHTGYLRAVSKSIETLFGISELDGRSFVRIGDAMRKRARPGFYRSILRESAGVEVCQVNSLETYVPSTQYPDLLQQDLSLIAFSTDIDPDNVRRMAESSGLPTSTLGDWHEVIDWAFATYGQSVDAVKSQAAYGRRLNYDAVSAQDAAPLYERMRRGDALSENDRKALEDHLMRYCIGRAEEHRLPVKLHCGYYAGIDRMPLDRVRRNAADLCPLLADFPNVKFVLMHIGYPYQDEYIALAKHYRNVTIDLCWAWIINPHGDRSIRQGVSDGRAIQQAPDVRRRLRHRRKHRRPRRDRPPGTRPGIERAG